MHPKPPGSAWSWRGLAALALGASVVLVPGVSSPAAAASPVIVELEIDSTITVTLITGFLVDGQTAATGSIRLQADPATGTWRGSGTLASKTTSATGACGTIHIAGEGVYDWVVNGAVLSPGIAADQISVDMDAGPIVEAEVVDNPGPDAYEVACAPGFTGVLNTWENLFFTAHRRDFKANGFRVDGWTLEATEATWQTGGPIATATWTGVCETGSRPELAGCKEKTTFRLVAVVDAPSDSAAPVGTPTASSGAPPTPSPPQTASTVPAVAATCAGSFCFDEGMMILGVAVLIAALAAALALWWWLTHRAGPDLVPGSTLDYSTLDYGKYLPDAEPLDYGKYLPDAEPLDYGKYLPDADLGGDLLSGSDAGPTPP